MYLTVALLFSLFCPLPIHFFIWPLVRLFYSQQLSTVLFVSLLIGCWSDILMGSPKFALLGFSYLATTFLLYDWKSYFFKDSHITLPVMTFCFSFVLNLVQLVVLLLFDYPLLTSELFYGPLFDVGFAWTIFAFVPFLWQLVAHYLKNIFVSRSS